MIKILVPRDRAEQFQQGFGEAEHTKEHRDQLVLYYEDPPAGMVKHKQGGQYSVNLRAKGKERACQLAADLWVRGLLELHSTDDDSEEDDDGSSV